MNDHERKRILLLYYGLSESFKLFREEIDCSPKAFAEQKLQVNNVVFGEEEWKAFKRRLIR